MNDQVDQEVVCSSELLLGDRVQCDGLGDKFPESDILFVLLEEGLNFGTDVEVLCKFLSKILERTFDKDHLGCGSHVVKTLGNTMEGKGDGVVFKGPSGGCPRFHF